MVRKDQVEETSEILGDLDLSFSGVNAQLAKSLVGRLSDRAAFWIVVAIGYGPFLLGQLSGIAGRGFERVVTFSDIGLVNTVVEELLLALLLVSFLWLRGWRMDHFNCRISLKGTGVGILLWLGLYGLQYLRGFAAAHIPFLDSALAQVRFTGHVSVIVALLVSIINPVFEEFLHLGFVIRSLESRGASIAVGVSVFLRLLYHIYQGPARMVV